MSHAVQHIFFDLDGTLVNTAPDLFDSINLLRARHAKTELTLGQFTHYISAGLDSILSSSFDQPMSDNQRQDLRHQYEEIYAQRCCNQSHLFPGMERLLDWLDARALGWSVVTNKKYRYSQTIIDRLDLSQRATHLLGGDSLSRCKPHPDQLEHICRQLQVEPRHTVMIGDSVLDLEAARSCGSIGVLAQWGYLPHIDTWRNWPIDHRVESPEQALILLEQLSNVD